MNRYDMILRVRDAIAEPATPDDSGYWKDDEILRYLNDGLKVLCEVRGIEEVERKAITSIKRIGVPQDMTYIDIIRLYPIGGNLYHGDVAPTNPDNGDIWVTSHLDYRTYDSSTSSWKDGTIPTAQEVQDFTITDNFIDFTMEKTGLLEVVGYRLPTLMNSDNDECEIPSPFDMGVIEYAIARCASKDDNKPKVEEHLTEFFRIKRQWETKRGYKNSHFVDRWYA
jgi:hypothetical protein